MTPWIEIAAVFGAPGVAAAYLSRGLEHILLGYDHLLFVFALVLVVRKTGPLLWAVTVFTIAHAIALALAALGAVHASALPVEAIIAFSILLLATEISGLRRRHGTLTTRFPWLVAFIFGALHGFGFAGPFRDLGLPLNDMPLALFAFNVGIEVGQLAFIAAVLGAGAWLRRVKLPAAVTRHALPVVTYGMGTLATFWFFERLAGF